MARADIALERHQFAKETPRPQHRIAAPAIAYGHDNQASAIRRKCLDEAIDQTRIDQGHIAETDHRAIGLGTHRGDAGLYRTGESSREIRIVREPHVKSVPCLPHLVRLMTRDD